MATIFVYGDADRAGIAIDFTRRSGIVAAVGRLVTDAAYHLSEAVTSRVLHALFRFATEHFAAEQSRTTNSISAARMRAFSDWY